MRSDGTKKSPVRMLVYLLLLAAVVALGYFTDIVDFTELKAVFSLKLTALRYSTSRFSPSSSSRKLPSVRLFSSER